MCGVFANSSEVVDSLERLFAMLMLCLCCCFAGTEEGMYGWVALNYLKGTFGEQPPSQRSFGLIEMGGASLQVTFQPAALEKGGDSPKLPGLVPVVLGGKTYHVYTHSYLSYGTEFCAPPYNA